MSNKFQYRLTLNAPFRVMLEAELKEFFLSPRALHFLPLLLLGVFLMNWTFNVAPPYTAIVIVVFCSLEPQFNNILFRSPNELETLNIFPVDWKEIILVKNTATIILTFLSVVVVSAGLYFFSPALIGIGAIGSSLLYCSTIIFPLLQLGNYLSISNPRRKCGWQYADFIEMLWMAVTLLIVSIPYAIIASQYDYMALYIVYAIACGLSWYFTSIPKSAKLLSNELITIFNR